MQPQVVGRDEPLAELDRFVGQIAERPASLTIVGEPGIGKTTVWQVAVDAAAARGYRVLVSRPGSSETALAYSGLADVLTHVERAHIDGLPEPQRRALDVALLITEPTGRTLEARAIFAGLGGVLQSLSREAPVLIAIDDEQWLDRSSLKALGYVSRRLEQAPVGILTTARLARTGAGSGPRLTDADVLKLGPLSPAALHRLIDAHLGVSLLRSIVLRVHRASSGNPFFALELARLLVGAGMPGPSDPLPVPDDLRELVAAGIGRLGPLAREGGWPGCVSRQCVAHG